ncbi:MAG: glycosyltransferase family 39 protein [Elusimicrobiota bacterium]
MTGPAREGRWFWVFAGCVVVVALGLRFWGVGYGLPAVFNADEPHHINVAVSFGRGSLNPGIFKYPTLWMYVLFGAYGAYFLVWSGLGLMRPVAEFGQLFVWHPGAFYLIARLLSAAFSALALHRVYRAGAVLGEARAGMWAAALLAVSPTLIASAHAARSDSLLLLLASVAWWSALRYHIRGRPRDLALCGAAVGLSASSHYIAAPLALVVPTAWCVRRWGGRGADRPPGAGGLLLALIAIPAAFFAGSPFVLLDWPAFVRDIRDVQAMAAAVAEAPAGAVVLRNMLSFAGAWAGGLAFAGGALWLAWRRRPLAVLLLLPVAGQVLFLASSPNGAWARFLIGVYPALALAAGLGAEALCRSLSADRFQAVVRAAVLLALMLPGAWKSYAFDADLVLSDTRTLAARWIEDNIRPGTRVLTFSEHTSPPLRLSRAHVERLLERTRREGHPRQRYYALMAAAHPGGGYDVYRVLQRASVLQAGPRHVAWSARGRAVLDVYEGLAPARSAGIGVVVYTSYGADAEGFRALGRFLRETEAEGELLKEFRPEPGAVRGPVIRVFRIDGSEVLGS